MERIQLLGILGSVQVNLRSENQPLCPTVKVGGPPEHSMLVSFLGVQVVMLLALDSLCRISHRGGLGYGVFGDVQEIGRMGN